MTLALNLARIDRWHLTRPTPNRRMKRARSVAQYRYLYADQCERRVWPNTDRRPAREPALCGIVRHAFEGRIASSKTYQPSAESVRRELRCNLNCRTR